jgi:hypothetical protein
MQKIKSFLVYLWAFLLILMIPAMFISFGSGLAQKLGKHLPIREGDFSQRNGSLGVAPEKK